MPQAWRLLPLSLAQWRHHPWRQGAVLLTLALGVALGWSVHLVNESALSEFSAAVRQTNGQPDATVRGPRDGFDDALYERLALQPEVLAASPVVEVDTYAREAQGERVAVRVLGVDALQLAAIAPTLMPLPGREAGFTAALNPGLVFANAAARAKLGLADGATLQLQTGTQWQALKLAGSVAAAGAPLLVMDIAGAQHTLGWQGRVSRIDVRLQPGSTLPALLQRLQAPPQVVASAPEEAAQRVSNLSRAYRVNLTVLALVALLVGAFMV
jgi:putative ABC transport system permease protein